MKQYYFAENGTFRARINNKQHSQTTQKQETPRQNVRMTDKSKLSTFVPNKTNINNTNNNNDQSTITTQFAREVAQLYQKKRKPTTTSRPSFKNKQNKNLKRAFDQARESQQIRNPKKRRKMAEKGNNHNYQLRSKGKAAGKGKEKEEAEIKNDDEPEREATPEIEHLENQPPAAPTPITIQSVLSKCKMTKEELLNAGEMALMGVRMRCNNKEAKVIVEHLKTEQLRIWIALSTTERKKVDEQARQQQEELQGMKEKLHKVTESLAAKQRNEEKANKVKYNTNKYKQKQNYENSHNTDLE